MKKMFLFLLVSFSSMELFAQGYIEQVHDFTAQNFSSWKIRCIGPFGVGRINAIAACEKNPNIIYVGAAGGGVWKSINGGFTWESVFNGLPTSNIGALAVQKNNPNVIWVGTGDGNPRNTMGMGKGIFKSTDGGLTWEYLGLEKTVNIHRILIDPENSNVIYVAAMGNCFTSHPERGVYKSEDSGKSWKLVLYTNEQSGCGELVMNLSNPQVLFAGMYEHKRTPWSFISGGKGSGVYMKKNGGKTWKRLGEKNGLQTGELGRIGLAISRSNENRVYALIESNKSALYRSDDGGENWQIVCDKTNESALSSRPFYYHEIYCDPQNESKVWCLSAEMLLSGDGGRKFQRKFLSLHSDFQAMWLSPSDSNLMMLGSDGEFSITRDGGQNWYCAEALPVGQVYKVNVDDDIPYHVMGGLQDNGSWYGTSYYTNRSEKSLTKKWFQINGGDGFTVIKSKTDNNFLLWNNNNTSSGISSIKKRTGVDSLSIFSQKDLRFNWNTPLCEDPFESNILYTGCQYLLRSINRGISWQVISNDLSTNDSTKWLPSYVGRNWDKDTTLRRYPNLVNGGLTREWAGGEFIVQFLQSHPHQ
jgi:photosystem II stability/assembly factor-like uncharacterized protein